MDTSSYIPETKHLSHQARIFHDTASRAVYALFWEQGTGKTKPTIDTAAYLYEAGEIDALIVVAPNGVHRNWKSDELPKHLPKRLHAATRVEYWESNKANNVGFKSKMKALLMHKGLAILLLSYDNAVTKNGKNYLWKFLRQRKCLYVLDESQNIKAPGAKRTISLVASGRYAKYKRILTGTPIGGGGPFDIYAQIKFLDEHFWKPHGFADYNVFKRHFGVWFTAEDCKRLNGYDPGYDKLEEYVHLDQLAAIVGTVSDRVLKTDVLDLPPKVFSKRYYELNSEQTRVYNELVDNYEAEFKDGARVDGQLAITRLLRLHQVCCGYAQTDDEEPSRLLGNNNPLLDCVEEEAKSSTSQGIIWARFSRDIDQVMDALGKRAVRYDGKVSDDEAERNKQAFQAGDIQWFVGNPQKGGTGLTLIQARTMMFMSNSFKLIERLQAEDRAHRFGLTWPVDYIDFVGTLPGNKQTISGKVITALRKHYDIARQITGDELREWI
jgi:SNF2 family DNA or RNA helicase